MENSIFRGYDRAALDREYDNRIKVPGFDFAGFLRQCEEDSVRARATHDCVLDVPYGESVTESLDIFRAATPGAPVHVFFHGGYWRMLDKNDFSYIANGLVPHDVNVVVVNYGLIPAVTMDGLLDQCRQALAWVVRNIGRYGGDPQRLSVSGHSAGGHIVAMMMASDWHPPLPLQHACIASGIFELEPIRLCFLNDTLHLSDEVASRNSPRYLARKSWCPLTIAVGDREGDEYLRQAQDFAHAWAGNEDAPRVVVLPATDHFSIREQLGDPSSKMVALALGRH